LATVRIRMIVERSTSYRWAASAIGTSWRTGCGQISYLCSGVKNPLRTAAGRVGATLANRRDRLIPPNPGQPRASGKPMPIHAHHAWTSSAIGHYSRGARSLRFAA
jgi:hypothetical protein